MTQSIKDILGGTGFSEPDEIRIIKNYIKEHYQSNAQITIRKSDIVITVNSAALASTLRPELYTIKKLCNTDKKLILRIGTIK